VNKVSENITWAQAIRSATADKNGINNYFTPDQLARMTVLANKVYEPMVAHFGKPIYISSFFRNKKVNELIGGATNSQHMANSGAAMDLDGDMTPGVTNKDIFIYLQYHSDFDQLILENVKPDGSVAWVHVSYKEGANRKEMLRMIIVDGHSTYERFDGFAEVDTTAPDIQVPNTTTSEPSTDSSVQNILLIIIIALIATIPIVLVLLYKRLKKFFTDLFNKKKPQDKVKIPDWVQFKINFVTIYKLIKRLFKRRNHVFKKDTRVV